MATADALALLQDIAKFLNQGSLEDSQSGRAGNPHNLIEESSGGNHDTRMMSAGEQATRDSQVGTQGPTPASTHESNSGGSEKPEAVLKPSDWVFQGTFARTASLEERKPPLYLIVSSTSVFFRHIHSWFPFLDSHLVLHDLADFADRAHSARASPKLGSHMAP
ncbi:hypothetical protein FOXYSP1_17932 [Fusarium oxysporum f. sp. phaseoli]